MPLVLSVSALLPASIHTPTVEVWAKGECSVAICHTFSISIGRDHGELRSYGEAIAEGCRLCVDTMVDGGCKSSEGLDGFESSTTL